MRYSFLVYSRPAPGKEAEYNDWYDRQHLPDLLKIPGIVAARRFKFSSVQMDTAAASELPYLAMYEIETQELQKVMEAIKSRAGTSEMIISDAIDMTCVSTAVFEMIPESIP